MHDHISQILLLNALSSTPDGSIIYILHLRDLYESETGHVVIQGFFFYNGQAHLMDNGINLGVVFDLILGLNVNGSIGRRAFFDADGIKCGQILLFDVPERVTIAGEGDSPQMSTRSIDDFQYTKKYCFWI